MRRSKRRSLFFPVLLVILVIAFFAALPLIIQYVKDPNSVDFSWGGMRSMYRGMHWTDLVLLYSIPGVIIIAALYFGIRDILGPWLSRRKTAGITPEKIAIMSTQDLLYLPLSVDVDDILEMATENLFRRPDTGAFRENFDAFLKKVGAAQVAVGKHLDMLDRLVDQGRLKAETKTIVEKLTHIMERSLGEEIGHRTCRILGKIGDSETAKRLVEWLTALEPYTVTNALAGLRTLLGRKEKILDDTTRKKAVGIITALIERRGAQDPVLFLEAADTLIELGEAEKVQPPLIHIMGGQDRFLACRAASLLCKAEAPGAKEALIQILKKEKNPALKRILRRGLWDVREAVNPDLPFNPEIWDLISDLTVRTDPVTAQAAIAKLMELGKTALPYLLEALRDLEHSVAISAAKVLEYMKDEAAVPLLIELLNKKWEELDKPLGSAVSALESIGDREALESLTGLALQANRNESFMIVSALGSMGIQSATDTLLRMLKEKKYRAPKISDDERGKLGWDAKLFQSSLEHGEGLLALLQALIQLGTVKEVTGCLFDEDSMVRAVAAEVLQEVEDPVAREALEQALAKEEDPEARKAMEKALGKAT
jgi:HEAT repeat protein